MCHIHVVIVLLSRTITQHDVIGRTSIYVNLFVPEPPCTAGNSSRGWLGACLTADEVCGSQVIAGTEMVRQSTRDAGEGEEGD
jgi:hypothetical protein